MTTLATAIIIVGAGFGLMLVALHVAEIIKDWREWLRR